MRNTPPPIALTQADVQAAAADGLITDTQANALWQRWAAQPAIHAVNGQAAEPGRSNGPGFGFTNVLYYFGGLVAIGLAYLVACLKVADHFQARTLPVPAGILATLVVVLTPLVVWCVQSLLGWWPPGGDVRFSADHTHISWRWLTLEVATLAAGAVMLGRYKLPFMVMPLAVTVWYLNGCDQRADVLGWFEPARL